MEKIVSIILIVGITALAIWSLVRSYTKPLVPPRRENGAVADEEMDKVVEMPDEKTGSEEIIEENIAYNKNHRKYGDILLEAEDEKNPNLNRIVIPSKVLDNNELKKANELVPTTLTLKINFMDKNGNLAGERTFNIGVKVTLHPASSEEIINNLCSARDTGFFKFIRWTTGELSLVKDVLLNLNEIKLDVVNKTAGKSGWFSTFKRLKAKSTILSKFSKGAQGFHPLGTIIISMDEAEIIKNKSGLDLTRVSDVKKVMDKFMLLGFVILDPATQTSMFIFDDSPDFEMQPFSGLKREGNGSNTDLKELLKVMNRF